MTRIFSILEQTGVSTLGEGPKETFFARNGNRKNPVMPKERVGLFIPEGTLDKLSEYLVEQYKPEGATHFDAFQMRGNDGRPTYVVVRYYK